MTDADDKLTPIPARPLHDILPLGRNARDSDSLAPARPQNGNMSVGPDIQLKGEISNCTTLVVEGNVDATLDGKALEIVQRGVFCGTARVESADIQGRFEGDLTVSELLRVESGGSVSGKLRYGRLEVAVGGDLTGEISKYVDENENSAADDSVEVTDEDEKPAANDSVEVIDEVG